jgi:TrmH family RNA methyltransferase
MEIISSRGNARLKHLRKLIDDKDCRYACGEFVVEGRLALSACAGASALFLCAGVPLPENPCGTVFVVEEKLFAALAPTENSQGILAVMPLRVSGPDAIKKTGRYVFLDRLQDPGNVGTIIRTACAFGMDGVIATPGCVDPFSPKVVRSSAGMISGIEIIRVDDISSLGSCSVLALDAGGQDIHAVKWPAGFVLAVGSEAQGILPELRARANTIVGIPMRESAESLNAAVAAGIAMFEASKQEK